MKTSRIVFFGTPQFAVPCLDILVRNKKNIVMVVTQPDQPAGRGKKLTAPPIKKYCDENNIACIQPKSIKSEKFYKIMKEFNADLSIVVAYGRIFPNSLLDLVPLSINVHASILPRWRGASPISQSIYHQDEETGVSIMRVVEELDAGPVMMIKKISIDQNDDTESLTGKLSSLGAQALFESVELIEAGKAEFKEQDENQVTFAPILEVTDALIHWDENASKIQHHIRAYAPSPGAYTSDGVERIKIYKSVVSDEKSNEVPGTLRREKKKLSVACRDQWLDLIEVQRPGKNRQGIVDFLNGYSQERKQWN
ncbi:MAG: methionyl-tRNA formyltransferase [Proteobacteria bacterium]|jgi:methionyl-tRNA formyltransferase|nr:methionyl-tRNA formyltransferase [Pseudomonadota bacterium]